MTEDLKLDPGIRLTVKMLQSWGFKTTDSGDGASKEGAGGGDMFDPLGVPHVFMVVDDPNWLVGEADRLRDYLKAGAGIALSDTVTIEASYSPGGRAVIALMGVSDADLPWSDDARKGAAS